MSRQQCVTHGAEMNHDQTQQDRTTVHEEGSNGTFADLIPNARKGQETDMTQKPTNDAAATSPRRLPRKKKEDAQAPETSAPVVARAPRARQPDVEGELLEIVADHDLDGMCAAWLVRRCRPGFKNARIVLVNSRTYDYTQDPRHAARKRGGSMAVDIIIPGLHSVKMASVQGVFSEVPKDIRGQRGSAFKAVMDMFAPPALKWALEPIVQMIEDYDGANNPLAQWGEAMEGMEPEQRRDLESVTMVGMYRSLLKGFWLAKAFNMRQKVFEIMVAHLEGYIENRRVQYEVAQMIEHAQRVGGTEKIRYSEDGLTVFLTEPGEITQSVAFDLGAHACVARRKNRDGTWQVSVTRAKYVPGLEVNTPEILTCFKPANDRYAESWYVTSPTKGDKIDFGALCVKVALHVTAVNNS